MARLKRTGVFTGLLVLGATIALGQYSGTYTIMPSGGDFASHAEAADSLMTYGVTGPCTLLMYDGTYHGQARLDSADWDSVAVMFKAAPGQSPAVEDTSYPWCIRYTDNITVDGVNSTVTSNTYCYYLYYADHTTIRNQTIEGYYGAYIYYSDAVTVENCNINAGYYGSYCYRSDSARFIGNRIKCGGYGLYMYYSGARYIVGNNITASGSYGIYAYRVATGTYSEYDTIAVNMMNGTSYGIYHYYHRNAYVYGNTFYGGSYAYYSYYGYGEEFYNNIFRCTGTYPLYKRYGGPPAGCDYNCYWPDPRPTYHSGHGAVSLEQWQNHTDQDSHSIYRDPLVGGPSNLHLRRGSPCVDSGLAFAGFPLDIDGDTIRNGIRDIGADEYTGGGGGPGMAGTYLIHQDPDSGDYSSFSDAIDDLILQGTAAACTFDVAAGTYNEQVVLGDYGDYWVTFQSRFYGTDSMEDVTIRSGSHAVDMTAAEFIALQGFNLIAGGSSNGVRMYYRGSEYARWCVVRDNDVNAYYGIYMYYANHCSVVGNKFSGGYYGGYLYYADANVFINNMFAPTGYGIYSYQTDSIKLLYNSFRGDYYGFYDYYCYYETMYCNIFQGGNYGWYKYYGNAHPLASDYNCFYGGIYAIYHSSYGGLTVSQWYGYSGMDYNSIQHDPLFRSSSDLHLQRESPCRGSALTMADIPYDIDGDSRDTISPDIGCDEWRSSGPPMSGVFYIHPHPDSGDYVSFLEAWEDICARGFGGDITLRAYSGTYEGDLDLRSVGNDTFQFTMEAVEGATPVIQASGGNTPAVSMTSARNVKIQGLTMNGYYGLRMWYTGSDSGCYSCSIVGNNINGTYYGTYIYRGVNNVVAGNKITTAGYYGFYWYGYPSGSCHDNTVYNNMIVSTYSYGYGTYFYYHDRLTFVYNSLHGNWYYAMFLSNSPNCKFKNNIVYNRYSPPYPYGNLYSYGNGAFESDYNCWWNEDTANPRRVLYPRTLPEWRDETGLDSNSIAHDPMFASVTNLHLKAGSGCRDSALAMTGMPYDIDGDSRDPISPDIGCDEWRDAGPPMSGVYYIHPNQDSGDFASFIEAWDQVALRGFGGDIALRAYAGTYEGSVYLGSVGNIVGPDTFRFTIEAVAGKTPVIQGSGGRTPAVSMTAARNVKIRGLTMNGYYGLRMYYSGNEGCSNCSIIGNSINGSYRGVYISRGNNNVFAGNIVRTDGDYGLYWYGGPTSHSRDNVVCNNMIISTSHSRYGMYSYYHDRLRLVYNSLYGSWGYGLNLAASTGLVVKDNIVYNGTDSTDQFCVSDSGNSAGEWDYNCLWGPNCNIAYKDDSVLDWTGWQAAGRDSHGINADPCYMSPTDLHLTDSSPCIDVGTTIPDITTDIDGELRDSTPCIGADEWIGTGVAEGMGKPLVVGLFRPAPNPASGPVRIRWQVPTLCQVSLKAFDISGRCVSTLVDGMVETGVYVTVWHGRDNSGRRLAPGIYFYTLETGDKKLTHKVVLTGAR